MKKMWAFIFLTLFSHLNVLYGAYSDAISNPQTIAGNSKIISNRTGQAINITFYPEQLSATFRNVQRYTYYVPPDKMVRLIYPGTNLRGIAWGPAGGVQNYSFTAPELDNAFHVELKPAGGVELQGG